MQLQPADSFIRNVHLTHGKSSLDFPEAALSIAASFFGNAHKSLECALNSFLCCDKVHLLMTKSNNGHGQDAAGEMRVLAVLAVL